MSSNNPILNSPYEEPVYHYATDQDGALNYQDVRPGRRIFAPDIHSIPVKQGPQGNIFEVNDLAAQYESYLINLVRKEVKQWRNNGYGNTTRVTKELLAFWFCNPERLVTKNLFFAQREAIETAIWLNEVALKSNAGQNILNRIEKECVKVNQDKGMQLPRIAFKMATGTGKTVVMGALILYHFFNRQEYRSDTRFADYFLLVAPGITIRDRLAVLQVDTEHQTSQDIHDYYRERGLVPEHYTRKLLNLNSRIVITNYHSFEPKTLQGNKRSPMDGKLDASGNKQEAKEDFSLVIKRLLSKFKPGRRLLVLNDEAHHCYLPKAKGKSTDEDNSKQENERAAVWYTGLTEIAKRFKLVSIYDLSATPYYLQGSGYPPYSLFAWVVSDFGLIEAIESGLVKIPFLPESDNTQDLDGAKLRNLYAHIDKSEFPKKGQRGKKKEAKEKGEIIGIEAPPKLPRLVKIALDQFYSHYEHYFEGEKKKAEEKMDLFSEPPVFIAVCNNTSVSKEVYKFIAGYELTDNEGNIIRNVEGHYPLFSNYEAGSLQPKAKAPTLLIDSDALENSDQVNDDFKKIFASEIAEFRKEYARQKGSGSAENITDAEILREVVNTVGKPGKLGAHIRCVVSVSMLTEGWDANTVTHIMGLRAFNSNLLCEQVAGRALRRKRYNLAPYDTKTGEQLPQNTRRTADIVWKFPPEYAHIIGVPFKMFKGGESTVVDPPDYTHIRALPDREEDYEITFPVIDGYRVENKDGRIAYDFSNLEHYQIDGSRFPTETIMETAFVADHEKLEVKSVLEMRDQEIIYHIAREFLRYQFGDIDGFPTFQRFKQVRDIVKEWYDTRLQVLNHAQEYKRLVYFENPKGVCDHIARGVNTHINTSEYIRPVFNYYNPFSSTRYVNGNTTKEIFTTQKSHVNYVVADTDSWEQIAAKTLEELEEVKSYVKNAFLGFTIPYVKEGEDKLYYPDFLAICQAADGSLINLIIEITGSNKTDKALKKWYVENRWLPAVNAVKDKYHYAPWAFIEVANDLRDIRNQLSNIIHSFSQETIA